MIDDGLVNKCDIEKDFKELKLSDHILLISAAFQ